MKPSYIPAYFMNWRHPELHKAAVAIDFAATGSYGVVPAEIFPDRAERQDWKEKYADELAANPALASALDAKGIDGAYQAAGLTRAQSEAVALHYAGYGQHEAARALGISQPSLRDRLLAGLEKLDRFIPIDRVDSEGVSINA